MWPQLIREKIYDPFIGDEMVAALSKRKVGKAAGSNGFLPDIGKWPFREVISL